MNNKHHLVCEAAICTTDPNLNYRDDVIWCPGEKVCKNTPHEKFQLIQQRINEGFKNGGFQDSDGFTANQLEASSF